MLGQNIFDKEITHFFIVSMCRIIRKRLIIKTNRLITDKKNYIDVVDSTVMHVDGHAQFCFID